METQGLNKTSALWLLAALLTTACAKEQSNGGNTGATTPATSTFCSNTSCGSTPGNPSGGSGGSGGGSGTITPNKAYSGATGSLNVCKNAADCSASEKATALQGMFINTTPNNPTSLQVNIDMTRTKDAIIINYLDNGRLVEAWFGTQFPFDTQRTNSKYNGWITQNIGLANPKTVYKGYFQDAFGAIVIVIDKTINDNDGTPASIVGGSIYYQNFLDGKVGESPCQSGTQYINPWTGMPYCDYGRNLMCWEISLGPYDCRTFLVGDAVSMASSLYPTAGNHGSARTKDYKKLGEFFGLSRAAAGL